MTEESIRKMSHDELVKAVVRVLNVAPVMSQNWHGHVLLEDNLADAFRNRLG